MADSLIQSVESLSISDKPNVTKRQKKSRQHLNCLEVLDKLKITYSEEVRYNDLKDIRPLPVDIQILIEDKVGIIEVDGIQHFEQSKKFHKYPTDLYRQRYHDYIKVYYCKSNKIYLLRISYREAGSESVYINKLVAMMKASSKSRIIFSNAELYKDYIDVNKATLIKFKNEAHNISYDIKEDKEDIEDTPRYRECIII